MTVGFIDSTSTINGPACNTLGFKSSPGVDITSTLTSRIPTSKSSSKSTRLLSADANKSMSPCLKSTGLMNACEDAIKKEKIEYQRNGTYVVMEGPQFSTLAESNLYRSWNADVIGMTNMPEAKLAREAEIRYASVSMVTDYDCWHSDHANVDVQQVIKILLGNAAKAKNMIKNLINNFENHINPKDPTNNCLDVAIITTPEKRTQKTKDKLKTIAGRVLNK